MTLEDYGWDEYFEKAYIHCKQKDYLPARVIMRNRDYYTLIYENGCINAKLSGRFKHTYGFNSIAPVVGDWVAIYVRDGVSDAVIQGLLSRKTCFSRKPAVSGGRKIRNGVIQGGETVEQVLAANIDTVFIVSGLDGNFNISRIERYLTVAGSSGARPVIILNKADLCSNPEEFLIQIERIALNNPVHCISVFTGAGAEVLNNYMEAGKTLAFLGSSGVGKSTIINFMFGEEKQTTKTTSTANGKGRHTTTCTELFMHESGCMLIDTPGLRELKLWCDEKAVEESFRDVKDLVSQCKFSDCTHEKESGCAIKDAIQNGQLSQERFENFKKLYSEVKDLEARKKQKELYIARARKRERGGIQK